MENQPPNQTHKINVINILPEIASKIQEIKTVHNLGNSILKTFGDLETGLKIAKLIGKYRF